MILRRPPKEIINATSVTANMTSSTYIELCLPGLIIPHMGYYRSGLQKKQTDTCKPCVEIKRFLVEMPLRMSSLSQ